MKQKVTAVLMGLGLLVAALVVSSSPAQAAKPTAAVVAQQAAAAALPCNVTPRGSYVNVRTGPGTGYYHYATLYYGSYADAVCSSTYGGYYNAASCAGGAGYYWVQVYFAGQYGYVAERCVYWYYD
jgi:hypothetical protein